MFFNNIGKRIRLLAAILAIVLCLGMLALAALFFVSYLKEENAALKQTALEGVIIFGVLAVVLPLCTWLIYGFGTLVSAAEKQAEDTKETKELLRHAIAEGGLSDDVARKVAIAIAKTMPQVAAAPRTAGNSAGPVQAPVQAPVQTPVRAPAPQRPVVPAPQPFAPVSPMQQPMAPAPQQPTAPVQPMAPVPQQPTAPMQPMAPAPQQPAAPAPFGAPATAQPLRPFGGNEETY